MNWKSLLIYLLIFLAGVIVGKIKINVKFMRGSCPVYMSRNYQNKYNYSESSDYL